MKRPTIILICWIIFRVLFSQDYGQFPLIERQKLLNDLELLYQGLDRYHSGMYWYTPKDSVNAAFDQVRSLISKDLTALAFHKLIAPLVALSREDHTDVYLPPDIRDKVEEQGTFLPMTVVFLDKKLYCVKDASGRNLGIEGNEITRINGFTPIEIVNQIGSLFASDGYIKSVKYSDHRFSREIRHVHFIL